MKGDPHELSLRSTVHPGLSDKPAAGYDTGTQAGDLVALMDALGHERFAVVGHDTGFAISYALAADHPDRVDRVALSPTT